MRELSRSKRDALLGQTWTSALASSTAQAGSSVAFEFVGPDWNQSLTFTDWERHATAAAAALVEAGATAGDRIAVAAPGGAVWPVMQLACCRIGALLVPLNPRLGPWDMQQLIGSSRPTVVVAIAEYRGVDVRQVIDDAVDAYGRPVVKVHLADSLLALNRSADGAPVGWVAWGQFISAGSADRLSSVEPALPATPVLLQWTSGTTSLPKGALLAGGPTLASMKEFTSRLEIDNNDVVFNPQPFHHCGGSLAGTLFPLVSGCTVVTLERYDAAEAQRSIRTHGCTVRGGQGAMYAMELGATGFDAAAYGTVTRAWVNGSVALKNKVREGMGIESVVSAYGLTEASSLVSVHAVTDPLDDRLHSDGRLLDGLEVGVDEDGVINSAPDARGEICVRGPYVMSGYFEDPEATATAIDGDGWLHTGDLGWVDAGGFLHFEDRLKDMIKPGGENVSTAEVEVVIAQFPEVKQVAVVGKPHDVLGEVPAAFIELSPGASLTAEEIVARCGRLMAPFKVPHTVLFVEAWPLTDSGKIIKRELQDLVRGSGPELGLVGKAG